MIIVLNGTAASGKGTLASMLAKYLHLSHYDFGLIFRAVADLRKFHSWTTIEQMINQGVLSHEAGHVLSNRVDITAALKSEEAGFAAAVLASQEEASLVAAAKKFVRHKAFVADGRTISTIYPQADRHFEIVSDYDTSQGRRLAQGGDATLFRERWSLDQARMGRSSRAVFVGTTGQTPEQSLHFILSHL
jgi:cytidylate kinase